SPHELPFAPQVEPIVRWRDNPIALAQFRRCLRRRQAVPRLVVIGILGLCALLLALAQHDPRAQVATRNELFALLALTLASGGATETRRCVGEDRPSRRLDFHRATPMSGWTVCLGYLVGSPSSQYVSAAILAPFMLVITAMAGRSIPVALAALAIVVFSS